jgi:predicted component of type VI protein secretion system
MDILLSINSPTDGKGREVKCSIVGGLVMGRGAEQGVLLDGPDLSREHLALTEDGGDIYITDLSVNGTWLNGTRLRKSAKTLVRPGDSIGVPGYNLTFRMADETQAANGRDQSAVIFPESQPATPPKPSGPLAMLDPVFGFLNSFTAMEKFLVVVALTGILLVVTYFGS